MKEKANNKAFTLAEMMIVLVIISISATVMIPLFRGNTFFQLQAATEELTSALQYCQNLAIAHQERYQMIFDSSTNEYKVCDQNGNMVDAPDKHAPSDAVDDYKYKLARKFSSDKNYTHIELKDISFDGSESIWFDSLGMPYSGNITSHTPLTSGTLTIAAGNFSRNITIEPVSGKITIN